jgi:hypothetical protein
MVGLLAAILAASGCGTSPATPSGSASAPVSPPPGATVSPGTSGSGVADISATLGKIEQDVQAIRELSLKQPVAPTITDQAGLQTVIDTDFNRENPPDLIAANEKLLKGLGLLPDGASLRDLYLKLLGSQVLGLYQPSSKRFYVLAKTGSFGPLEQFTFAHEFDHVLQDQNFGLDKLRISDPGQGDRSLAHLSVPEGDATLVMALWAQQHLTPAQLLGLAGSMGPGSQQVLTDMPRILRETLMFPYTTGLNFVLAARTTGGWKAVDDLYATPPTSTEQVLHPDKYGSHEQPIAVADSAGLAAKLGTGWKLSLEDTLGEFQLGIWLEDASGGRVDAATAKAAAAGWGGDRVAVLEGPNGVWAIVLQTAWDSEGEAAQFEAAASGTTQGLSHPAKVLPGTGGTQRTVLVASDAGTLSAAANALGLAG